MSNPYEVKIAFDKKISTTGVIQTIPVSDESKIRIIIANSTGGNTILVKGRINGQTDWDTIVSVSGNSKQVVNISTYDEVQFECTAYASSSNYVEVIASSFNPAGGSTTIDVPAGGPISNDEITFTSSNSSVSIVGNTATNTIDFITSSAPATKYTAIFNNTSSWVLNGSNYEYKILSATHGKANPVTETYETISGMDSLVFPEILRNAGNDVILQVTQVPDNRYNGKVIIL